MKSEEAIVAPQTKLKLVPKGLLSIERRKYHSIDLHAGFIKGCFNVLNKTNLKCSDPKYSYIRMAKSNKILRLSKKLCTKNNNLLWAKFKY